MSGDIQSNQNTGPRAPLPASDLLQAINNTPDLAPEGDLIERNPEVVGQLWSRLSSFSEGSNPTDSRKFVDEVRQGLNEIKDILAPDSRSFEIVFSDSVDSRSEWTAREFDRRLRHLDQHPIEIDGSMITAAQHEHTATLVRPVNCSELILVFVDPPGSDFKYQALNLSLGNFAHGWTPAEALAGLAVKDRRDRKFARPNGSGSVSRVVNKAFLSAYLDAERDDSLLSDYLSTANAAPNTSVPTIRVLRKFAR